MTIDASICRDKTVRDICLHRDNTGKPCAILNGREDMCPRDRQFQKDKAAQEEDAGER